MKPIQLTKNKEVIVDDEDYEYLNQWKWFCLNYEYAARNSKYKNKKRNMILMHRVIMKCPDNMQVDHINGNTLDNRKINLRICSKRNNNINHNKRKDSNSKYKGVRKRQNKWQARITIHKKQIHLGYFNTEDEAAKEYNKAAIKYFKEFAKLNKV